MLENDDIKSIDFNKLGSEPRIEYNDGDIAFHSDIRELPIEDGTMKVDSIYIILVCTGGKIQLELNSAFYTASRNDLIICRPNDIVSKCMMSPDFEAAIVCLSHKVFIELFSESELWDKAFYFSDNLTFHVSDDSLALMEMYGRILRFKIKAKGMPYRKEVIRSIMRAVFYELLSNIPTKNTYGAGLIKQTDVLFKKFIELLISFRAKPRSVSWYADRLNVTPKHLSTVSKRVSGKTAHEWINEYMKIDIVYYLKNTTRSIKEVANELEFPSISFFGKYCRQHFGVSPTLLRKQLREVR